MRTNFARFGFGSLVGQAGGRKGWFIPDRVLDVSFSKNGVLEYAKTIESGWGSNEARPIKSESAARLSRALGF